MNFLLHMHNTETGGHSFLEEVLLHGVLETLKLIPFLFLTYLLMEFIEHRAKGGINRFIERSGAFGPAVGGLLGAIPQCGFSSVGSNLYTGRVISLGTLVAVFLSTSDEMLPILIGGGMAPRTVIGILVYKTSAGIIMGFLIDLILRIGGGGKRKINIDEICERGGCNCEGGGIFKSALKHTVSITAFIFAITLIINSLVFFIGESRLEALIYDKPFISHLIAAIFGLLPNCAVSVALTGFYTEGLITMGTMLSGLFSAGGVGLLVLFRVNRNIKENIAITAILMLAGLALGLLADISGLTALIA